MRFQHTNALLREIGSWLCDFEYDVAYKLRPDGTFDTYSTRTRQPHAIATWSDLPDRVQYWYCARYPRMKSNIQQ